VSQPVPYTLTLTCGSEFKFYIPFTKSGHSSKLRMAVASTVILVGFEVLIAVVIKSLSSGI
jgi:hypothetical protein